MRNRLVVALALIAIAMAGMALFNTVDAEQEVECYVLHNYYYDKEFNSYVAEIFYTPCKEDIARRYNR